METILPGTPYANRILEQCKTDLDALARSGVHPGLAFVLVGEDPASMVYVRRKQKAAKALGIRSDLIKLPQETTTVQLIEQIQLINDDPAIHGLIAQQPLPASIDTFAVTSSIAPTKDVDGLHPHNLGLLAARRNDGLYACTACGCIYLLQQAGIAIASKAATVVGRSLIVGRPLALMLTDAGATVTICHTKTSNLAAACRNADILVVAAGCAHLVTAQMVKPGAVVLDVGISRGSNGKLCGDVDFEEVRKVARYITPVPGGIGPLTVAMLMRNTVLAARQTIR